MTPVEMVEAAIKELEQLQQERGLAGDWLYEVDPNTPWPDDPRVGLVQGGPDVMLMRAVPGVLTILRADYEVSTKNNWIPDKNVLVLAKQIVGIE